MKGEFRFSRLLTGIAFLVLLMFPNIRQVALAEKTRTLFPKVALKPFIIEAQAMEGAPQRSDAIKILADLSREATKQAERALKNKRIAGAVENVSTEKKTEEVTLTGSVRLPISLPPHVIGFNAATRGGVFATGKVTLSKPDGAVIAEEEVKLFWRDGWWMNGARHRHNAPLNEVLADFVRKAADRALQRFPKKIRANERSASKT